MASVSNNIIYSKNQPSIPTISQITNIYPTSGKDAGSGTKIVLEIPTGGGAAGQYLCGSMSYLKFNYSNKSTDKSVTLPYGGCNGLFEKVELYSAGRLVHSLNHFADWSSVMLDVGSDPNMGTGTDDMISGQQGGGVRKGQTVAASSKKQFCCQIPSLILNRHEDTPTYLLSGGLRLEITLVNSTDGGTWEAAASTPDFSLDDFTANLQYSNISSEAQSIVSAKNGPTPESSLSLYEVFTDVINKDETSSSKLIPCRKSSVKTIISWWKPSLAATAQQDSVSRDRLEVNSYSYVLNGKNIPTQPVTGSNELGRNGMIMEIARAYHRVSGGNRVGKLGADYDTSDAGRANSSTFMIAVDLEQTSRKSNSVYSGINTFSAPPQLIMDFNANSATKTGYHCVHYDAVLKIANGQMSVSI